MYVIDVCENSHTPCETRKINRFLCPWLLLGLLMRSPHKKTHTFKGRESTEFWWNRMKYQWLTESQQKEARQADFDKNMQIWNTERDAWKWKLDERWRSNGSEKWALVYSAVSECGILNEQVAAWRVEVEMEYSITTVGEESGKKLLDLSTPSSQKYGKLERIGNILCLEATGKSLLVFKLQGIKSSFKLCLD